VGEVVVAGAAAMGGRGVWDVLCTRRHDECWQATDARSANGVLVMDITPEKGGDDAEWVLPFVHVGASVSSDVERAQGCAGWFTVMILAVDAEKVRAEGIPSGRVRTFPGVFGKESDVDHVHPLVQVPGMGICLSQRSTAVGENSPQRVSCAGLNGEMVRNVVSMYRWIACVVYNLEGCSTATLHVQAGLGFVTGGSSADEDDVSRWAKIGMAQRCLLWLQRVLCSVGWARRGSALLRGRDEEDGQDDRTRSG
jgi:hypothetical protein